MTADELEARMSMDELLEWNEWFKMESEANKKAMAEAKTRGRRR